MNDNRQYILNEGEWVVAENTGEIACYGLGSCIGVFLYDKFSKIGAGAHIALPGEVSKNKSDQIIDNMISAMLMRGTHRLTIRASIVGGANILNMPSYNIGERNTSFIKEALKKRGILIQIEDLRGKISRTAKFNIATGDLYINNIKQQQLRITNP